MARTYEPIASQTLGSGVGTVTFSDIPATWTDLKVIITGSWASGTTDNIYMRFNSDTASNYSCTLLYGNGTSAASTRLSSQTQGVVGQFSTTAGSVGNCIADIMSYPNSSVYKTVLSSSAAPNYQVVRWVNLWRSTSAITSLSLFGASGINFSSGTTVALHGIRAA